MEPQRLDTISRAGAEVDAGLRAHFLRVYNVMGAGLAVTGFIAWITSQTPALFQAVHGTPLGWVIAFAPLGILFFGLTPNKVHRMSLTMVNGLYFLITALIGLSMSYVFVAFTGESVARVFFITAAMFGAMSIWGYTTKKDLSKMGSFLIMAVIGLIIASIVNIFLGSSMLQFAISGIGVIVFTLLIAFDTQAIKETYHPSHGEVANLKMATMSAVSLYINVINLFQFLLQFLGNRE